MEKIRMITQQNASPLGLYINKADLINMPKNSGEIGFEILSEMDLPNSYKIYLTTELKGKSFEDVICISSVGEVEEIYSVSDVPGWHFEPEIMYHDDKLTDILYDCDVRLGDVLRGVFSYY